MCFFQGGYGEGECPRDSGVSKGQSARRRGGTRGGICASKFCENERLGISSNLYEYIFLIPYKYV